LIIRHLLAAADSRNLSESVFREFSLLFQNSVCNDLRRQLFGEILLNFELWARAKRAVLVIIASAWSCQLYRSFVPVTFEICSFRSLIFALVEYFPAGSAPEILDVRQCIVHMALTVALSDHFTKTDVNVLIGLCMHFQNTPEIADLIGLVKCLVTCPIPLLIADPEMRGVFVEMYDLLKSPSSEFAFLALEVLLALHQGKIPMAVTLEEHVLVMLPFFASQASQEFLEKMLVIASIRPELIPVCFYIVFSNNVPELEQVLMVKLKKQAMSMTSLLWGMMCFARR
jgi:hypothetical protein